MSSTSNDNKRWLQMWRDQQTEFHQLKVNPLLQRFWQTLKLDKGSRVLVPLCGKSLDMTWLAGQGYKVIGVELSPIAVREFFVEAGLKPRKQRIGNFIRWSSGGITIWCGDFFALSKQQLGQIDMVFDRAALTALPEEFRSGYITQLRSLVNTATDVFLLTVEDIEQGSLQMSQPIDIEIGHLYNHLFNIVLLHDELQQMEPQQTTETHNKVYRLEARK